MNDKEKYLLADLFDWIQEGIDDKSIEEVSCLSDFELNKSKNRKNILKKELSFFYLFTAHSYCKSQKVSSQSVNILFNLIHDKIFNDEKKPEWFALLNKRIQDYGKSYCSQKAGKFFGITGLLQILI